MDKQISPFPHVTVTIGNHSQEDLVSAIVSCHVLQTASQPACCECQLRGDSVSQLSIEPGEPLNLCIGKEQAPLFTGTIYSVSRTRDAQKNSFITIRAFDALIALTHTSRVRTFQEIGVVRIVQESAKTLGKQVLVHTGESRWDYLVQYNETDLAFINRIAQLQGIYIQVQADKLHLYDLEKGIDQIKDLNNDCTLLDLTIDKSILIGPTTVQASSWSSIHNEVMTDSHSTTNESGPIQWMRSHFNTPHTSLEGLHRYCLTETQRMAQKGCSIDATVSGTPSLFPGVSVSARISAHGANNHGVVTQAKHSITAQAGYTTFLTTRPIEPEQEHRSLSFLPGVVSDINDPLKQGRIKVVYPSLNNCESGWLTTLFLGAGANKGVIVLPDRKDCVLVGIPQDNPTKGIVLGGIYTKETKIDSYGIEDDQVKQYRIVTRGGQEIILSDSDNSIEVKTAGEHKIVLNDNEERVTLTHANASCLEFSKKGARLHSTGNMTIEAPGKQVVIQGAKIDFKQK